MKRAWILIPLAFALWYVVPRETQPDGSPRFFDFHIMYNAALGNFDAIPNWAQDGRQWYGWLYADWVAHLFKPLTLFDVSTAQWVWFLVQYIFYAYLLWQLTEVNYGWIVGLGTIKLAAWLLWVGNVGLTLAALSTTFVGSALAACIKPYCLGFAFLNAYKSEVRHWIGKAADD